MTSSFRPLAAALLLAIPRTAVSYVGYALAPLLLVRWRLSAGQAAFLAGLFAYSALALLLSAMSGQVSTTAFFLGWALLLPTVLFIAHVGVHGNAHDLAMFLRTLNIAFVILSVVKIPFEGIPYLTGPPDLWNALLGHGGAKILTIVGFFGVIQELLIAERGRKISWIAMVAAVLNLAVPSYLLGIGVAVLAIGLAYLRRLRIAVPILLIVGVVAWEVAATRVGGVNSDAQSILGVHPKVFAYLASMDTLLHGHPLGAGVGQLGSTPQQWLDPYLAGRNSAPDLPGLVQSSLYIEHIAPYTQFSTSRASAFLSSLNQPVTGFAALLGEWGLAAVAIVAALLRRLALAARGSRAVLAAAIFIVAANLVDTWFDSPWFAAAVLAFFGLSSALARERTLGSPSEGGEIDSEVVSHRRQGPRRRRANRLVAANPERAKSQ